MSESINDGELEMWRSGPSVYAPAVATLWHQRVLRLMAERDGFIARLDTAEKERDLWRSEWQQITDTTAAIQRQRDTLRTALIEAQSWIEFPLTATRSKWTYRPANVLLRRIREALTTDTGALRGAGEGDA